jgi:hypothetical protein
MYKQQEKFFRERPGAWALCFVFILLFTSFGLYKLGDLSVMLWKVWTVRSWVAVPATINYVESEYVPGKYGGWRTVARYSYRFQDVAYEGNRVGVYNNLDGFNPSPRAAYRELQRHYRDGTPFHCFINPQQPQESVLYPYFQWDVFFAVAFPAIAFSFCGWPLIQIWKFCPWARRAG